MTGRGAGSEIGRRSDGHVHIRKLALHLGEKGGADLAHADHKHPDPGQDQKKRDQNAQVRFDVDMRKTVDQQLYKKSARFSRMPSAL